MLPQHGKAAVSRPSGKTFADRSRMRDNRPPWINPKWEVSNR